MKISIIVPVYNTQEYLNRCIDSILSQTYKDLELLLIDDGSTDKSGKICDSYSENDDRVKVFHIENKGVSYARNIGLNNATGDYIGFVDSDDSILEDMYEKLVKIVEDFNVDIVTSDFKLNGEVIKNSLSEDVVYDEPSIKEQVLPSFTKLNQIGTYEFKNKIIKREVIINGNCEFPIGFSYQEDLMFMIQVYANAKSLYYLPESFYMYQPLQTGLYSAYRKDGGKKLIEAKKKIEYYIDKYKINNINYNNFYLAFLYNITYYIYRTSNRIKDKKERKVLIYYVLKNEEVVKTCNKILDFATSDDLKMAKAIAKGKTKKAIFLIRFVRSGKYAKLQSFINKIRGNR